MRLLAFQGPLAYWGKRLLAFQGSSRLPGRRISGADPRYCIQGVNGGNFFVEAPKGLKMHYRHLPFNIFAWQPEYPATNARNVSNLPRFATLSRRLLGRLLTSVPNAQ